MNNYMINKMTLFRLPLMVVLFSIMITALAFTVNGVTQYRNYHNLNITLVNHEPDPVGPGEVVELRFRVENHGGVAAKDVQVELLPEFPFSLRPGDPAVKNVGTIESLQRGDDGAIVKYKVIVDKGSPDGEHDIRLRYKSADDADWIVFEPFLVRVQSHIAILSITKVVSVPVSIAPGDKGRVSIELTNYASSLLKDILVKLDLSGTSLNPSGSANERVVSSIAPQATAKAEFELIANPDAAAGLVKVPLTISYSDVTGKNFSKSNSISLMVGDVPEITIGIERTDIYTKKAVGSVVLRVVNKGTTDVKFLTIKLGQPEHAEIIGTDESYVGNLDSDDFSTSEFKLYVKDAKDEVQLPVVVEYKDANNNNFRKEEAIPLKLYSGSEAKKISGKGNGSLLWIGALVIAAAGFFLYRRWKKRKSRQHQ